MTRPHASPASRLLRLSIGAVALALASAVALPLAAQTVTNTFSGLSGSSKEPIDIESDMLVVRDKEKLATFTGNVKAVQGATTLSAAELDVHYTGGNRLGMGGGEGEGSDAAPVADKTAESKKDGAGNPDTQITKIEAKGNVVITSQDNQTTTSEWALYDVPSQLVTVGGNVVLTQGENVLKGDRLVIDLKTGQSRFEHTANSNAGGRIRALFMPKGGMPKGIKPGDSKHEGSEGPALKPRPGPAGSNFGADAQMPLDPMRQQ